MGNPLLPEFFSTFGIPVYDADRAAKRLVLTNNNIRHSIIKHFGEASYINGQYNKQHIAAIVFNNEEKLKLLNAIIHPATISDANNWFLQQTAPYALKEAALIFESGSEKYLDMVIGVFAPEEIRIQRIIERENTTAEHVIARMKKQMAEDEKMSRCNYVINNSGKESVISQVVQLHITLTGIAIHPTKKADSV